MPTVEEIRQKLVTHGLTREDADNIKGKKELMTKLAEYETMEETVEENPFDSLEADPTDDIGYLESVADEMIENAVPTPDSPQWNDYVLRQFEEDELMDGHPSVDGLRRVVEKLLGNIRNLSIDIVQAPSLQNGYVSTARCYVEIETHLDEDGHRRKYTLSDVADATRESCQSPYNLHLSAMAGTRAEGRVYRKLLRLRKVISHEELAPENAVIPDAPFAVGEDIDDVQILGLDKVCKRLNINVMKYVNSGSRTYKTIDEVGKESASQMLAYLQNHYQQKKEKIPTKIIGYDPGWRPENGND